LELGLYALKRITTLLVPYHPPETPSGLEEVRKARMNLAQGYPDGDKKETSKEKSATDFESMKDFFEYIITIQYKEFREENKAFREEMKRDIKAPQDNVEINNAKFLDS
jgi:hypothetical protein